MNSWNKDQARLPVTLFLRGLFNLLSPLNLLLVSAGVNVPSVSDGLDVSQMASDVNITQIESSPFTVGK